MTSGEPLSRIVRVDPLPSEGQVVTIEASPAEREALAALHKLPAIETLTASLNLRRSGQGGVRVTGNVHAGLTQVCVVSLEPFPATVDEEVDVRFASSPGDGAARGPSEAPEAFSTADEDEPDPIVDGKIDLGALLAEFFALGLDPYPRKPGASFEPPKEQRIRIRGFSIFRARPSRRAN